MSIEIIPQVVEALHSREASLRASRECNASTTRGIISILIVLVGSSYIIFFGFVSKILCAITKRSNCDESAFFCVCFDFQLQKDCIVQDVLWILEKLKYNLLEVYFGLYMTFLYIVLTLLFSTKVVFSSTGPWRSQ